MWAAGALFYHMLSGNPPFQGESLGEVFDRVANEPPLPMAASPETPIDEPLENAVVEAVPEVGRRREGEQAPPQEGDEDADDQPETAAPVEVARQRRAFSRRATSTSGERHPPETEFPT